MSLFKSAKKVLNKVVDAVGYSSGSTAAAKLIKDETGLSASDQAGIGAGVGAVSSLLGLGNSESGLLSGLLSGDNNNGLLGTLFGSGENSLSSIIGSVVKGAVGIGSDYFSNQQYYKDQRKLNEQKFGYDRQLADEAYQRDVAMWNMQNAYNAPKAQMERLQEAGMNPNLVYGSGNVTGNTAGSAPSYPQVQYPSSKASKLDLMRNVLGIFDEYQSIQNQALQNQREAYKLMLQERSLELAEDRERNRDAQNQRQFEMMMSNFGFQRERENTRVQEHKQDREDKINAPTTTEKEFNWIADKVGDALQYPIYAGFKYLEWLSGNETKTSGKYKKR